MSPLAEDGLKRGLKDVYVDKTESSFIDGLTGKLLYRGYSIHDLAEKSTFEEVIYLLLYGTLPNRQQLDQLDKEFRANRTIPEDIYQIISLCRNSHPLDAVYSAQSTETHNHGHIYLYFI